MRLIWPTTEGRYRALLKVVPRLRECCRQGQADVVSNSSNNIHQTWGPPFSRALWSTCMRTEGVQLSNSGLDGQTQISLGAT